MATENDISRWFDLGLNEGAGHLVVIQDGSRHEDYPLYVGRHEDVYSVAARYDGVNMQRVLAIYDLATALEPQLDDVLAGHS